MQMFDISQWPVISSCKLYNWSLGLITASFFYLRMPRVHLPCYCFALSWTSVKIEGLQSPFSLILSCISLKISRVLVLSAFKLSLLTQSKAEGAAFTLPVSARFEMSTPSVTSGPILRCWLCRGPGSLSPWWPFILWTLNCLTTW